MHLFFNIKKLFMSCVKTFCCSRNLNKKMIFINFIKFTANFLYEFEFKMNFLRMLIFIFVFERFTTWITIDVVEKAVVLFRKGLQSNSIEQFSKELNTGRRLLFFNCWLAAPRPTFDHSHPILITAFFTFSTQRSPGTS